MKPPPFDYHVPETVEEACAAKAEHGAHAALLAGGQSLIPLMSSRRMTPRVLIDIKRIPPLAAVEREDSSLVIGAAVRQWRLHEDGEINSAVPVLAEGALHIGHPETRHRGTVGGSLAHADPVAELPTLSFALGAEIVVRKADGERRVGARDFFVGARQTALAPDEVITAVRFPILGPDVGWGFAEIARRHGDPAMATAVAMLELDEQGAVGDVSVTVGAVAGRPQRVSGVENQLRGNKATPELVAAGARAARELVESEPESQETVGPTPHPPRIPLHYRQRLAQAVTAQALTRALKRLKGGDVS